MSSILKINGTPIKTPLPGNFTIEKYNITISSRLANGLMVMDLIAKKRKFLFKYPVIEKAELDVILSLIDTNAMFFTLTYTENDVEKSAICYAGHIPQQRWKSYGKWIWKDVNFDLIER